MVAVYRKFKDPIVLAALELCNRLDEVCDDFPPSWLRAKLLESIPEKSTRGMEVDNHYLRYKLLSSVYRLCAFLGWIELYRQEIVFLDSGNKRLSRKSNGLIDEIRADLADGQLVGEGSAYLHDALIYREEQRAIGESMIVGGAGGRVVMGYGEFCDSYTSYSVTGRSHWVKRAGEWLLDAKAEKDFVLIRIRCLLIHLIDLVKVLEPSRLRKPQRDMRAKYLSLVPGARRTSVKGRWEGLVSNLRTHLVLALHERFVRRQ